MKFRNKIGVITDHDVYAVIKEFDPSLPRTVESEIHQLFATEEKGEVGLSLSRFLSILSDDHAVGSSAPRFNEVRGKKCPVPLI